LVNDIALSFIRYAKDHRFTPERLKEQMINLPVPLPLAEMGLEMYENYQRALAYRGAVDFDDLIRLALSALEWDALLLDRLRQRWPYVLEDEAQDSSLLQEEILRLLVGANGNWVRVGDPNQAIYETFTTANPDYLRNFLHQPDVIEKELPNSGRSTQGVINLANHLVQWVQKAHPNEAIRNALQSPPLIEPAPSDDPQPNPSDEQTFIRIIKEKLSPTEEIKVIVSDIESWYQAHAESTVAVLAPRNQRAFEIVDELRKRQIPFIDDLLRSSSTTRFSAGTLGNILQYLADPQSARKLATVYKVWRRGDRKDEVASLHTEKMAEILRKIHHIEEFIWPIAGKDWLEETGFANQAPEEYARLIQFRELIRRWQGSVLLPIDQIVLSLSQDLLNEPGELAIAHKLAVLLRRAQGDHPDWKLPELTGELAVIAKNERRFLGFSDSDTGFNPDKYKGKIVVSTMHKAKGLEWDRVYLMSVNNYDFPSGMPGDTYIPEKWFIRDHLNLEAEALAQLKIAFSTDEYSWYEEGMPTKEARLDYARERLRLLYVGITRAKKELVISWNNGRRGESIPAMPLIELYSYLEK
jgi:DNA helicase-2/ATP-dependent DNA helicase PcrA